MASYTTLDFLPDLTPSQLSDAELLTFSPISPPLADSDWDNAISVLGSEPHAILHSIYRFDAKNEATYDTFSRSAMDPFLLIIYDNQGNAIQTNSESSEFLEKHDVIFDWIAPYTGTYYVNASWNQTVSDTFYSLSIYEDIDTVTSTDIAVSAATLSHLTSLGVTVQQANDFILLHVNEPTIIYNTAKQNDVTTVMLSEITGFATSDINGYFASYGLNTTELDSNSLDPIDTGTSDKRDLLSPDMVVFGAVISFNENSGVLSTAALKESILSFTGPDVYNSRFNPSNFKGSEDGIFTPEELGGISHLGNIPATSESLESLFFGTAINARRNFSFDEFVDISLNNGGDYTKTRELEINAYSSPTNDPYFKNDTDIAFVVNTAGISGWVSSDGNENPPFLDGVLLFV